MSEYVIDPGANIGHVALHVSDVDQALRFYQGVLGMELVQRLGDEMAFVSAGGYHHHVGLFAGASERRPPSTAPGLIHLAVRYPTRRALAFAVRHVLEAGAPVQMVADHGDTESIYLTDPDGNAVELYADAPREQWGRRPGGPLDLAGLLALTET